MYGKSGKIVFKPYAPRQLQLLPPSLDELIPANHAVRVVDAIVERMDLSALLARYDGGGASSYHPRMLLKVVVYAYSQRVYSSRQIAKQVRESIPYLWLAGGNQPDFRTINRFRSSRLQGVIEQVFASVVTLLAEAGLVDLTELFVDGTKIEANANRYSFVWRKATENYEKRLQQNVRQLFGEIDVLNAEEDRRYGVQDLPEVGEHAAPIAPEQMEQKIQEIEQRLATEEDPPDKDSGGDEPPTPRKQRRRQLRKAAKKLREDYLPRQRRYDEQKRTFGERNSYSKTDPDATFMRMKEDHMRNGQLKPGYNVQIGTQHQFIVNYTLHPNPTDSPCLIPHLNGLDSKLGANLQTLTADAGYGSEENYVFLAHRGIDAYVKYNTFDREQTRAYRTDGYRVENLAYDEKGDFYRCPTGQRLVYRETLQRRSANGYPSTYRVYEAQDCTGCSQSTHCHRGRGNRQIQINATLQQLRAQARDRLLSERGRRYRSRRLAEPESVFGQIKHNRGFRRFLLRGKPKVSVEFGLLSIAHNLLKWHAVGA